MSRPKPTSGGGKYKEPIIITAKEVFGTKKFTYAEAKKFVIGYTRQIQADLVNSGDLKKVIMTTGDVHHSLLSGDIKSYSKSFRLYQFRHEDRTKNGWTHDEDIEKP
jgi:hypothetical protein